MCCWEASAEGLWSCIVLSGELAVSKAEGNIMDVIYIYGPVKFLKVALLYAFCLGHLLCVCFFLGGF